MLDRCRLVGEGVEVVHHPGQIEVGIRIEALEKALGLVVEIALDLEVDAERRPVGPARASELQPQALLRDVRDVGEHACHRQADIGGQAGAVVVPVGKVLVAGDRRPRYGRERDVLRSQTRRRAHEDTVPDLARMIDRPLEDLHAAERAADRSVQALDAEVGEEPPVHGHEVGDREVRKAQPVLLARRRVGRRRPRAATAAAE